MIYKVDVSKTKITVQETVSNMCSVREQIALNIYDKLADCRPGYLTELKSIHMNIDKTAHLGKVKLFNLLWLSNKVIVHIVKGYM